MYNGWLFFLALFLPGKKVNNNNTNNNNKDLLPH
jgi:hypothetical protein